jgi:selenocysteine lyase/cysteine desulfurase
MLAESTGAPAPREGLAENAFDELERAITVVLETYANVHRGSGQHSQVTTLLYEQARQVVLAHLDLDPRRHVVIFCTPRRAARLAATLAPARPRVVSSAELGLPLGIRALVVERAALPPGAPGESGGGTARLVGPRWVVWAAAPDRFEAGTPAIVNAIALARALGLRRRFGQAAFVSTEAALLSPVEVLRDDSLEDRRGRELLEALRRTRPGADGRVPTTAGDERYVHVDNAASTPALAPVWEAVRRAWRLPPEARREVVEAVRNLVAESLGAPLSDYEVLFTSNTTEAINLVAESLGSRTAAPPPVVLTTLLEHNSNELPWRTTAGATVRRLGIDREGFVDLEALEQELTDSATRGHPIELVAVSGASNVLGTCNDIATIARVVHAHGALLLVDGAQLVAHRPVDLGASGADFFAFSGHKVYAPFGTGALLARKGKLSFDPVDLESIRASGDENVGGIVALGKALELLCRIGFETIQREERALTARAVSGLAALRGVTVLGVSDPDSPRFAARSGVVAFSVPSSASARIARTLAEEHGVGVRYGCHCAHLLVKQMLRIPRALEQFQGLIVRLFPRLELPGVVRVSFGVTNTEADVDAFLAAMRAATGGGAPPPPGATAARPAPRADTTRRAARRRIEAFATAASREVFAPLD